MTLREFFDAEYAPIHQLSDRSIVLYRHTIAVFGRFLGREAEYSDLTDLTVSQFLQWRAKTVKVSSVLKDRVQLLAISNHLAKKRRIPEFLVLPPMRAPGRVPRCYLMDDVEKLLTAAGRWYGEVGGLPRSWYYVTIIRCCLETAGRIGEVRRCRWSDVDLERHTLTFRAENRKGQTRDVERSISPQLCQLLARHKRGGSELIWPATKHESTLWLHLKTLCKRAGIENRGFHGLRKTAASYVAATYGHEQATRLCDHSKPQTTHRHYFDSRVVGTGPSAASVLPPLTALLGSPAPTESEPDRGPAP
jgi:integrase